MYGAHAADDGPSRSVDMLVSQEMIPTEQGVKLRYGSATGIAGSRISGSERSSSSGASSFRRRTVVDTAGLPAYESNASGNVVGAPSGRREGR